MLGLLVVGMALGTVAAGAWLLGGGSALAALGIYSLVSTGCVLLTAIICHAIAERRSARDAGIARPSETALEAAE